MRLCLRKKYVDNGASVSPAMEKALAIVSWSGMKLLIYNYFSISGQLNILDHTTYKYDSGSLEEYG